MTNYKKKAEEYKAQMIEKTERLSEEKKSKALAIIESRDEGWWYENGLDVLCCKFGAAMRYIQNGALQERDIYNGPAVHAFN